MQLLCLKVFFFSSYACSERKRSVQCVVRPSTVGETDNDTQLAGRAGLRVDRSCDPDRPVAIHWFFCRANLPLCSLFALFSPWLRSTRSEKRLSSSPACFSSLFLSFVRICCEMFVFFAIRRSSFCRVPVRAPSRPAVLQPPRDSADVLQLSADGPWRLRLPLRAVGAGGLERGAAVLWRPLGFRRVCRIFLSRLPTNRSVDQSPKSCCPVVASTSASFGGRASGCRPRFYRSARFLSAEDARDKGRRGFCLVGAIQQGNSSWLASPDPSPRDWLTEVIASLWPGAETEWGLKQAGPHRWRWLTADSLGLTLWARLEWEFLMGSNAMLQ